MLISSAVIGNSGSMAVSSMHRDTVDGSPPDSTEEANDGGRLFMIVSVPGINQHSIDDEELNLDVSLSFSCLVLLDSLSRGFAKLCDD